MWKLYRTHVFLGGLLISWRRGSPGVQLYFGGRKVFQFGFKISEEEERLVHQLLAIDARIGELLHEGELQSRSSDPPDHEKLGDVT